MTPSRSLSRQIPVPVRAALLALLTTLLLCSTLVAPPQASAVTTREAALIAKINYARTSRGLPPLRVRWGLMDYARKHARAMAARGSLYHTSDFTVICCWRSIGENVGYGGSVTQVHGAFMASSHHRDNVLDRDWRGVGVGVYYKNGRLWITEIFRQPR